MKDVRSIMQELRRADVKLSLSGDDLEVNAPQGTLSEAVLAEIQANKDVLIGYLRKNLGKTGFSHIKPVDKKGNYPLSSSQRRLWLLSQFEDANVAYNIPRVCVLEGPLDQQALTFCFQSLLDRHEILRTVFREDEQNEIRQIILPVNETGFQITCQDVRGESDQDELVKKAVQDVCLHPFDLAVGPLLRAALFQVADHKWVFCYVMHHIISDGWSMEILIRELFLCYNAYTNGNVPPFSPLSIHYKDYAVWQQGQLNSGAFKAHKDWWLKQFEGELPLSVFPFDKARPAVKTYAGSLVRRRFHPKGKQGIKQLIHDQGCTMFMGMLALVKALMYRYTGQEDLIIGSPVAGREHIDLANQIGFYVNTLPLRTRFKGENSYLELLAQVKQVTLNATRYQAYPFDELIHELPIQPDRSRNPLFDVMVLFQTVDNNNVEEIKDHGVLKVTRYKAEESGVSKLDLMFGFSEAGEELSVWIEYNSDIYYKETVERIADHLQHLLEAILANPSAPIQQLNYVSAAETHQLLVDFNDTLLDYPEDKTIIDLFEAQVADTPDSIAIVFEEKELSYRQLNECANRLGGYLRQHYSIQRDDLIGIMLERNEWLVIAMLGVLKSGGAYVPIDVDYPRERIDYLIANSCCKLVIDEELLTCFKEEESRYDSHNIPSVTTAGDLAYVIYTSGSTGDPKGVMIGHNNMNAFINWCKKEFSSAHFDIVYASTSICFDLSIFELFYPLCIGKKIRLLTNALAIPNYLPVDEKVLLNTVPSVIGSLLNEQTDLSTVTVLNMAGEPIPEKFLGNLDFEKMQVRNLYGPSEYTTYSTIYRITEPGSILIGRPIANTSVYILDNEHDLQPVGVTGEICLTGHGLAQGYLHQPGFTSAKFVANPFIEGGRMYRTGDLGRWLADGNIEFLGRKDDQVKIRGYRIELGEIENALQQHPAIDSATVIAQTDNNGTKQLIGYIVSGQPLMAAALRSYLSSKLPAYMLPGHFVQLQSLPLTPNGKIDKKRLPHADRKEMLSGAAYVGARNEIEAALVLIWQQVLGTENVSVKDDFFVLGGHSLKATWLASHIYKELGVKIKIKSLFEHPVLEAQAALIQQSKKEDFSPISVIPESANYPLSPAQLALWVSCQFDGGNMAYNMPAVYVLEGNVDQASLNYSFEALLARHESLRTVFKEDAKGSIRQFIKAPEEVGFKLWHMDLRKEKDRYEKAESALHKLTHDAFDLAAGPLIRAALFRVEDGKWQFAYTLHHIICDGWSIGVLINDLMQLYEARLKGQQDPLPPLMVQYKDYVAWQLDQLSGEKEAVHKTYWLKQLEGELPVLQLPGTYTRLSEKTYNGGIVNRIINAQLNKALKGICHEQGSTLFMGLLAVVNTFLYKYTYQEDIIIGTSVAGRQHIDLKDQIGYYLNTLALRIRFKAEDNYLELLKQVKRVTLEAYEHQVYPFAELTHALQVDRDVSRNALFDVFVLLQNADNINRQEQYQLGALEIKPYEGIQNNSSKVDLAFFFMEKEAELVLSIKYNSDLFDEEVVSRMGGEFEQLLKAIIENPSIPISYINFPQPAGECIDRASAFNAFIQNDF